MHARTHVRAGRFQNDPAQIELSLQRDVQSGEVRQASRSEGEIGDFPGFIGNDRAGELRAQRVPLERLGSGRNFFVRIDICDRQNELGLVARLEQQLGPDRRNFGIADSAAIEQVRRVSILIAIENGEIGSDCVGQAAGNVGTDVEIVCILAQATPASLDTGARCELRIRGHDVDQTTSGVAAEHRALRPTKNLDAGDFDKVDLCRIGIALVNAVHIDRDV